MRSKIIKKFLFLIIFLIASVTTVSKCFGENYTITFDTFPVDFQKGYGCGEVYTEGDYSMVSYGTYGGMILFNSITNNNITRMNYETIYMGIAYTGRPSLQRIDGDAFNLIGLDIGSYNSWTLVFNISFTGYFRDGSSLIATIPLGRNNPLKTYDFNWNNLTRIQFDSDGFAMDNIKLSTVPESTTLLLLGLGAVMVRLRSPQVLRRKRS